MQIEKTSSAASFSTRCLVPEPIDALDYQVVWRASWPAFFCPESSDRGHDFNLVDGVLVCSNCLDRCRVREAGPWLKWTQMLAAFGSIQDMPTGGDPDFAHMKQMCN